MSASVDPKIATRTTARQVLGRVDQRQWLMPMSCVGSFMGDVEALGEADATLENAHADHRRGEMLEIYGYGSNPSRDKPFAYSDGIAIIPVHGTLINRFSCSWGFITGYNFILAQMNAAIEDTDVKLIVFDINSNGGEATGCFELCDKIYEARDKKPMVAVVDSNCCSAAYAIGSSTPKLYVTPSGWAGSIGVITMHFDVSGYYAQMGVVPTVIADDPHKADGNPFEPLPDDVKADIKAQVSKRYGEFIELVVRNRGLDSQAIRDMQSRSFRADDALENGLIDAVASPADAVAEFLGELGADDPAEVSEEDDEDMAAQAQNPAAAEAAAAPADHSAAVTAERARIKGIQSCEEAKGRESLASHLALNTAMSADEAKAILEASPKADAAAAPAAAAAAAPAPADAAAGATAEQGAQGFLAAMDAGKSPNVGADGGGEGEGENADAPSRAKRAMLAAGYTAKDKASGTTAH